MMPKERPNCDRGIGVLGGTFDPVHLGHLHAAAAVRAALGLTEVRLIPAATPPHRAPPRASDQDRATMVALAVRDFPGLVSDARELHRPGKSFTIDTLHELRRELPHCPIYLILGTDAFAGLTGWHRWRELTAFAHLVVIDRPGTDLPELPEALRSWLTQRRGDLPAKAPAGQVFFLNVPPHPITASNVRARLERGETVTDLLPASVLAYIRAHQLYQRQADGSTEA